MSISPLEWKNELDPGENDLLSFIEKKPYKAYAINELELLPRSDNVLLAIAQVLALQARLDNLIKKRLIKSKHLRGYTYYISSKAL